MSISENIQKITSGIPPQVKIVAVSKRKPIEDILEAYEAGQRIFGENRVQELIEKQPLLPDDIKWHMVGHLQTNKVKFIAGFVDMIHSVDTLKLLKVIDKEALKVNRIIPCLLQVHIASEETKFGFSKDDILQLMSSSEISEMGNIRIDGVMGMATYTPDMEQVRSEFRNLSEIFVELRDSCFSSFPDFKEISMGMSGDYSVAIDEGSTIVRLGTVIFGIRTY